MDHRLIAIIHVTFHGGEPHRKVLSTVEALLRADGQVYHLNFDDNEIVFYLWGEAKIDYGLLDRLKKLLQENGYTDFTIVADEYRKTGRPYSFVAGKAPNSEVTPR